MLDGKVVIVTGAGNGMGRAHARALAAHGARVVVNDVKAPGPRRAGQPAAQFAVRGVADVRGVPARDRAGLPPALWHFAGKAGLDPVFTRHVGLFQRRLRRGRLAASG